MVKQTIKLFESLNYVLPYIAVKFIDHDSTEIVSIHVLQNVYNPLLVSLYFTKNLCLSSCVDIITEIIGTGPVCIFHSRR